MEKQNTTIAKEPRGYTLVELVTVMAIIAILGTMLLSMLNTGVKFYQNSNTAMDNQSNVRLAIAYITVKIRQNDIANGISVVDESDSLDNQFKVLKIKDTGSPSGNNFFWIYFDNDKLLEHFGTEFASDLVNDTEIVDNLKSVDITQTEASIIEVAVLSKDGSTSLASNITLRSSL